MKGLNIAYITGITLVATLGGLLFGYDTAVISGTVESLREFFTIPLGLSEFVHGITVSSALVGCIVGGIISGWLSSHWGRKRSLIFASFLFFVSALGSAWPETLFFAKGTPSISLLLTFNLYRIVGGVGVGLASALVPMYIGEIAPAGIRGRMVSCNQFAIIFGMLVVYFVNWGIARGQSSDWIHDTGWRWMFASEAIPALLFGTLLLLVPETPRYLAMRGRDERALAVLEKINGRGAAEQTLGEIKQSIRNATSGRLLAYGWTVIVVGVMLSVFQQFVGINTVLYYAPEIFKNMGGAGRDTSMMQTVVMGLVNVVFTLLAIATVDKWGRKPLLITGSLGMAVGMVALAAMSAFGGIGIWTLVFIIIFTASFMMSWGPICWVLIAEIFPNRIRGRAVAVAVMAQWLANFLISSTFPAMREFSTPLTYGFYGAMALLSALFVWRMVPETKGKTLEQMETLWSSIK